MVDATRRARTPNACQLCGTDISERGWQAKFCELCSDYRSYHYRTPLAEVPPMILHTECIVCATPFAQPQWQPCCNRICSGRNAAAQRFNRKLTKQCAGCGEEFTTTNPKRKCCTKACTQWCHWNPGALRVLDKECAFCLTPFRSDTPRRKYCGAECQARINQQRRNKRTAACFVEDVSKKVVAKRDKWCCQICRKKVDHELAWPHPMSWSLDHIVPISKGGEHSYANTQLAHLTCNISKRAHTLKPTQLALIG